MVILLHQCKLWPSCTIASVLPMEIDVLGAGLRLDTLHIWLIIFLCLKSLHEKRNSCTLLSVLAASLRRLDVVFLISVLSPVILKVLLLLEAFLQIVSEVHLTR